MTHCNVDIIRGVFASVLPLHYSEEGVKAGFPSPAQDYTDKFLDFNHELISHPAATFYATVIGDSMIEAGIADGDKLVVDRALNAQDGDVVVAHLNGEFTVKYLDLSGIRNGVVRLRPANKAYKSITVTRDDQFEIWGVVVHLIKTFRKG